LLCEDKFLPQQFDRICGVVFPANQFQSHRSAGFSADQISAFGHGFVGGENIANALDNQAVSQSSALGGRVRDDFLEQKHVCLLIQSEFGSDADRFGRVFNDVFAKRQSASRSAKAVWAAVWHCAANTKRQAKPMVEAVFILGSRLCTVHWT
jgi:hypothetical protein